MKPHEYAKNVGELVVATFRIVKDIKLIEQQNLGELTEKINVHDTLKGKKRYKLSYELTLKDIVCNIIPRVVLEARAENDPNKNSYCPNTIDAILEDFDKQAYDQIHKGAYIAAAFKAINEGLKEKEDAGREGPYYKGENENNPGYDKVLSGVKALMEKGKFGALANEPVASYNPISNPRVLYDIINKLKKELEKYGINNAVIQQALIDGNYDKVLKNAKRGFLRPRDEKNVYYLEPEILAKVIYSQAKHFEYDNGVKKKIDRLDEVSTEEPSKVTKLVTDRPRIIVTQERIDKYDQRFLDP